MDFKGKNIVLVGLMGSGKSSTGALLAKHFKRKMVSTDKMIEDQAGLTIPQIFKEKGESYFRQLEREVVSKVAAEKNIVIDCGGGSIVNPDNFKDLKKNGLIIYLTASINCLYERLKDKTNRPLLEGKNLKARLKELLDNRKNSYEQADLKIDTDWKTPAQVCQDIIEVLQ
jgi:shikimate kinase